MPQRRIEIPVPITLVDPATKAKIDDPSAIVSFYTLIEKIMSNPMWVETYPALLAQRSIANAMDKAKATTASEVTVAESDWELLKKAVEKPATTLGQTVLQGFGYNPLVMPQLMPLLEAIMSAERVD